MFIFTFKGSLAYSQICNPARFLGVSHFLSPGRINWLRAYGLYGGFSCRDFLLELISDQILTLGIWKGIIEMSLENPTWAWEQACTGINYPKGVLLVYAYNWRCPCLWKYSPTDRALLHVSFLTGVSRYNLLDLQRWNVWPGVKIGKLTEMSYRVNADQFEWRWPAGIEYDSGAAWTQVNVVIMNTNKRRELAILSILRRAA